VPHTASHGTTRHAFVPFLSSTNGKDGCSRIDGRRDDDDDDDDGNADDDGIAVDA
jgi:hypothetical protein